MNNKQRKQIRELLVSGISDPIDSGYDTALAGVEFMADCFWSEALKWRIEKRQRVNHSGIMKEWLQGLPSCVSFPFYNSDILKTFELLEKSEAYQDRFIEDYWNELGNQGWHLVQKIILNKGV